MSEGSPPHWSDDWSDTEPPLRTYIIDRGDGYLAVHSNCVNLYDLDLFTGRLRAALTGSPEPDEDDDRPDNVEIATLQAARFAIIDRRQLWEGVTARLAPNDDTDRAVVMREHIDALIAADAALSTILEFLTVVRDADDDDEAGS